MGLTGTMPSPVTPIVISDSEDDLDIIETIPDDTIVIDDTISDGEEIMGLNGQDAAMDEAVGVIEPGTVIFGLPNGELMIAAIPLTIVPMEEDDMSYEPTMEPTAGDINSESDSHVPTADLHEVGLHPYATDDESVTVPLSVVPESEGPSPPAAVPNTFEAGGPSHLHPSAASSDPVPPSSPPMERRFDLLASHVDQQTHRLEGELYYLRQRLVHVEAGVDTSRMRIDSSESDMAGFHNRLLAAEGRAAAAEERTRVLEQVMRTGAQEMLRRFPHPPAP